MKKVLVSLVVAVVLGVGALAGMVATSPVARADALNLCDDEAFKEANPDLWEAAGCRTGDDQNKTIFPAVKFFIEVVLSVIGIVGWG